MTGLRRLVLAHAREFFRVRQEVFLAYALPVLFMIVLGGVLSNVPDIGSVTNEALGLTVGVVAAPGRADDPFVRAVDAVPTLRVIHTTESDALARLGAGEFAAVVQLPANGAVGVLYNTTRTQRSRVVLNRLYGIAAELNAAALGRPLPVALHVEGIGGEDDYSSYVHFFVPGVVAMAVLPGVVFSLTPTLVAQRERGVLRRLWLTPASMGSYGVSHVLFRLALGLSQTLVILVTAAVVFHPPFTYGVLRLLALCTAGSLAGSAIAFLLAAVARSHAAAITLAQVTMIPLLLACGAFFPLELMPAAARPAIDLLPLTPLAAGVRGVLNFDHAWGTVLPQIGLLLAYAAVAGALGWRFFRWDTE